MYALMENGNYVREVVGNTAFSPTHFQTPESLSDAERVRFNLYLIEVDMPSLSATQKLGSMIHAVAGRIVKRTWEVVAKTTAELDADKIRAAIEFNAPILAQLAAADLKIMRAVTEGDTARINTHRAAQAALRDKIKN